VGKIITRVHHYHHVVISTPDRVGYSARRNSPGVQAARTVTAAFADTRKDDL